MVDSDTLNRWEKRKHHTKELLKATTRDILLRKGFTDLTIQEIADTADLSRGTFYLHFGSLDEIVWTIVQESLDRAAQEFLTGYQEMPYMQRKYHVWRRIFQFVAEHRALLQVLFGEKGHPHFARQIETYFAQMIIDSVESGAYIPKMPEGYPTTFLVQFITGALVQIIIWSLETDYSPEQLGQYFYETLTRESMPEDYRSLSSGA